MPTRKVINEASRSVYLNEISIVVHRWNRMLGKMGIDFRFHVPDKRFNRRIGVYRDFHFTPAGEAVDAAAFRQGLAEWLPSQAEKDHVMSLMQPVYAPGKIAGWIAPPARGIDGKPVAYEYVRV